MKTLEVLAAIGLATVIWFTGKTVMAVNEIVNGPFPKKSKMEVKGATEGS